MNGIFLWNKEKFTGQNTENKFIFFNKVNNILCPKIIVVCNLIQTNVYIKINKCTPLSQQLAQVLKRFVMKIIPLPKKYKYYFISFII